MIYFLAFTTLMFALFAANFMVKYHRECERNTALTRQLNRRPEPPFRVD